MALDLFREDKSCQHDISKMVPGSAGAFWSCHGGYGLVLGESLGGSSCRIKDMYISSEFNHQMVALSLHPPYYRKRFRFSNVTWYHDVLLYEL